MDQAIEVLLSMEIKDWASFSRPYFQLYQFGSNITNIRCVNGSNVSCQISNDDVISTFLDKNDVSILKIVFIFNQFMSEIIFN